MSTCHEGSWIGVDLDGTLAHYDRWVGITHIGEPIPAMLERVKEWRKAGTGVRIFTARVGPGQPPGFVFLAKEAIENWCIKHLGERLPITAEKDLKMFQLWDDRCVCVKRNSGEILGANEEPDTGKDS